MSGKCENCNFYVYDEYYEDYVCDLYLDEDELVRFMNRKSDSCPYWKLDDEYKSAARQ
ncbi:MAG: hypothetical protein IKU80_00990 [Firmicutes bacterium]|nr:hypothetical protein [Bacillota bacterium]